MVYDKILNSILRTKSRLPTVENASYVKVEVFDRFQEELKIHFYHGLESASTYHNYLLQKPPYSLDILCNFCTDLYINNK